MDKTKRTFNANIKYLNKQFFKRKISMKENYPFRDNIHLLKITYKYDKFEELKLRINVQKKKSKSLVPSSQTLSL